MEPSGFCGSRGTKEIWELRRNSHVEPVEKLSIRRLILVPAVITLAVTLLRLVGELQQWSPTLFSREAGGAGALVGIVWLVPIFGIYFAIRLNRAGQGPASRGRAIGYALVALVTAFVLGFAISKLSPSVVANIVLFSLASVLSLWIAYRGWPELGKVEVVYGLAARIPVAIVMLIAMAANWGTHYELGPPGFPEMGLVSKWFLIGLSASTLLVDSLHRDRRITLRECCVVLPEEPSNQRAGIPKSGSQRTRRTRVVIPSSASRVWIRQSFRGYLRLASGFPRFGKPTAKAAVRLPSLRDRCHCAAAPFD